MPFLGAFAKLSKATISFVMYVRPSVHPHGTTRLPLDGFSWHLIFVYFSKNGWENSKIHQNLTRIMDTIREDRYTFLIISRSILLRMRNVSDKNCRENQNTHFVFRNFFSSANRAVYEIVEKYCRAGQYNTAQAHCMLGT
jgi:hypothetical protein